MCVNNLCLCHQQYNLLLCFRKFPLYVVILSEPWMQDLFVFMIITMADCCWLYACSYLGSSDLLLQPDAVTSYPNVESSSVLGGLVFCRYTSAVYCHCDTTLHSTPETREHRQIRMRSITKRRDVTSTGTVSPRKGLGSSPPPPSSAGLPLSPTRVL